MIISGFMDVLYNIFRVLTAPISIPQLPAEVGGFIDTMVSYVGAGLGIVANYTHIQYLLVLFGIVIAIDVGLWIYKLVMFLIHKIPLANIK